MIGETLKLSGVRKRYGAAWAVHEANIAIAAGEFVSIVGPSGSGKTTLLSMIAGFEAPTEGSINVGRHDVTRIAPNRRNIGMVFQRYALFPHMTVRSNVEFPLRMRRLSKLPGARRKVASILDLVQLGGLEERLPHQLSGGQQQRVALARAMVFDPPVILMDVPLGALDKKLREHMQVEIKRMQERLGATVVYVTHDQEEALTMSDRVVVMRAGRIEQEGRPADLYQYPRTAFVADFVGEINFLPARVRAVSQHSVEVSIGALSSLVVPKRNVMASGLASGSFCRVAARPEHVELRQGSDVSDGAIPGRLESVIFSGSHKTAMVRLNDPVATLVRAQMSAAWCQFERGAEVNVRFASEKPLLFSAEAEANA